MRKFHALLSPLRIRNFVIKNRLEVTSSLPHFSQGPEKYPSDELMRHYIEIAKNGAGIVTVAGVNSTLGLPPLPQFIDISHFPEFDIYDPLNQNYMVQLTEAIHSYGAIASMALVPASNIFPYFNERGEQELIMPNALGRAPTPEEMAELQAHFQSGSEKDKEEGLSFAEHPLGDEISVETLEKLAISHAQQAAQLKFLGFDMITLHMSYRATVMAKLLSPLLNRRTDSFGGDITGRAQFPLLVLRRVREAVGPDFLIELHVSGEEEGGNTTDEVITFLKMAQEYADIAQIRCGHVDASSPTEFEPVSVPALAAAEKIRASGLTIPVSCVGGWFDPDEANAAVQEGRVDIIGMARPWISNPNYARLLMEDRADELVPCIRCNRCHGRGDKDPFATTCSVNPVFGMERFKECVATEPGNSKKVAVIGGGPGGMRAALWLTERGHRVTIYEASAALGGAIRHADVMSFKWPLRRYKNWLIEQVKKHDIEVRLNTRAVPEDIQGQFDAVFVAIGAESIRPPIPGADSDKVFPATDVLEGKTTAEGTVVIIGGGEVGIETGMHLAQLGHKVTVLEMRELIAADSTKIHYHEILEKAWQSTKNLEAITNATVTRIEDRGVVYRDRNGSEQFVAADTVLLSAGRRARIEEALRFESAAAHFVMIGDCRKPGSVQTTNRSAYYAAISL